MLVARAARLARQARVHDAPHAAPIADREPRDAVADRDDLARELVARHRWILRRAERAPQVPGGGVHVAVAHAAVRELEQDVARAERATVRVDRFESTLRVARRHADARRRTHRDGTIDAR
jgi:hypothetical protein